MKVSTTAVANCFDYPYYEDKGRNLIKQAREVGELPQLIDSLVDLAMDSSPNYRVGAIEALGIIDEAQQTPKVIDTLTRILPDGQQREYSLGLCIYADEDDMRTPGQVAAKVLGKWHVKGAISPLIDIASDRQNWIWNRVAAIEALGEIGNLRALPSLQLIRSSREQAVWGVYNIERRLVIGDLAEIAIKKISENGSNTKEHL